MCCNCCQMRDSAYLIKEIYFLFYLDIESCWSWLDFAHDILVVLKAIASRMVEQQN